MLFTHSPWIGHLNRVGQLGCVQWSGVNNTQYICCCSICVIGNQQEHSELCIGRPSCIGWYLKLLLDKVIEKYIGRCLIGTGGPFSWLDLREIFMRQKEHSAGRVRY